METIVHGVNMPGEKTAIIACASCTTFGFGNKFCPGSHLARQQLAVALDVVLERLPGLRLVAAEPPSGAVLRSSPSVLARWDAPSA